MTVAAAFIGLVPLLWATGTGADVMRRLAAPMLGGLFTSFLHGTADLPDHLLRRQRLFPAQAGSNSFVAYCPSRSPHRLSMAGDGEEYHA